MYAWVERQETLVRYDLAALTLDGSEIPIRVIAQLWPFDDARLLEAIWRIQAREGRAGAIEALGFVGGHYEKRRRAGEHPGPPISHVRLYRSEWPRLDPLARDVDAPAARVLVYEAAVRELASTR
jgi:hypothetical protein